jgi:hypothetical protein
MAPDTLKIAFVKWASEGKGKEKRLGTSRVGVKIG